MARRAIQDRNERARPSPSLAEEAFLSVLRTTDQLQWRVGEFLKPYGLSPTQYNVLRILRGAGSPGLASSDVGCRMINRDPDITRLIDRLEQRGLVERRREQKDRRVITVNISPAGLKLLKSLDGPIEEFHRNLLGNLGDAQLRSLIRLLDRARQQAI